MSENLTFEELPRAVTLLTEEVSELKQLILDKSKDPPKEKAEKLFTIQEAADFLSLSVATLYSKVSRGEIPVMKRTKRLYFSRTELLEYVKKGRRKSNYEIEAEAHKYLSEKKEGLSHEK